ncbi:hypothetical protein J2Q11_00130 [Tenacibaculum finnmarkense genomovar finnmarkense]|uniref:Uncharacterized protein n=1 Tax=Tenacibaculum finnmarkense genomovar finnmarkense TaxID=1458503 RepID=A0AAP1RH75_9FLAO|nr:hypothetical protein [Tenacibaculum finnmarkense]MBE7649090.1 hypothetical protein [Tenacibaculum finnmarkense genomovar ulcerans]MBE7653683.1 hypothetical protein [Tenacibaculum finnmarkense genomovar finnmarkense]MBE7695987.1 hypothetical protein [Tenacibaculum finnmarkense genomovar finnmarkense]MCD8416804.1 hypothetical protein [Tenacibaculum finnmarkense genomovar finnmarkense]MCD8428195.1 hypothetical protein [Tenacibaculum finnmarkense genomovar finnmarkense]
MNLKEIFKTYIFPIILLLIGAYIKAGENLKSITDYFSNSTSKLLNLLDYQFHLWQIIVFIVLFSILKVAIRKKSINETKREKKMKKSIKKIGDEHLVYINNSTDSFLFKFNAKVKNERYKILDLRPYCKNNHELILMTELCYGEYKCNCGKEINHNLFKDVESGIITSLEKNE